MKERLGLAHLLNKGPPPRVLATARGRNYGETEDGQQLQGGHQPTQDNTSQKDMV